MAKVLVTGAAGFIGYHVSASLLKRGFEVYGLDNLDPYYSVPLKAARIAHLLEDEAFSFLRIDLTDKEHLAHRWRRISPDYVIHLGAQAGVRHSIDQPNAYIWANVLGFQNVIDLVRETRPKNFVYASSSSVYAGVKQRPYVEDVTNPVSLYGSTKLANELVAKSYGYLFELPSTGLRFFSVYGPYGRPDMVMFKFARAMLAGEPVELYGEGDMSRDWTYVGDIVSGILAAMEKPQIGAVYNLGAGRYHHLGYMADQLAASLGVLYQKKLLPMQLGDSKSSLADISRAQADLGYDPKVKLEVGIPEFADWYLRDGYRYA